MLDQRVENRKRITAGQCLFVLAFLLAFAIRFFDLGRSFLSNGEAVSALQALEVAQGSRPLVGGQPGYTIFTGILFAIFGANEVTARFWPALVGSLVVWAPRLFRRRLGYPAAVVLAFFLAFEPGLVAISRQAGGLVFAVVFALLAFGFWENRSWTLAGICTGLAMLGGPGFWFALPPLALAFVWSAAFDRRAADSDESASADALKESKAVGLRSTLLWAGVTLAAAGTLFFFVPSGLGGAVTALLTYLNGWVQASNVSGVQIGVALAVYELMALVLGLWGIAASWREQNPVDAFLARWFLLGLVFILVYPARQVSYLVWVTVPLWALTGRQIVRIYRELPADWKIVTGYTALVFSLLVFIWMNFVYITVNPVAEGESRGRLIVISIAAVMVVMLMLLMRWGWSSLEATTGFSTGLNLMLVIFTFAAVWNSSGLGRRPDTELWSADAQMEPAGTVAEGDLFLKTVDDFYQLRGVDENPVNLEVEGVELPSLRWALRNTPNVSFTRQVSSDAQPAMIVTSDQDKPAQTTNYTGQGFVWQQQPTWANLTPIEWARWAASREVPVEKNTIILWVRSNLFPGGNLSTTGESQ